MPNPTASETGAEAVGPKHDYKSKLSKGMVCELARPTLGWSYACISMVLLILRGIKQPSSLGMQRMQLPCSM